MREKIEIIDFSMYENKLLEQHLHEKAERGWMIKDISRFSIIYEKCEPQDAYFYVDFINRKHPFTTHKSGKVMDYAQFLEGYDCHHVCGNGYRQVIRIPSPNFKFYTDEEEKKKLYKKSAGKDLIATLVVWVVFFIGFLVGLMNGNAAKVTDYFGILYFIVLLSMFYVVIYPHLRKVPLNSKVRKYVLLSTNLFITIYIINTILAKNSMVNLAYWMIISMITMGLVILLENTKIIQSANESYVVKIILIMIGFIIGIFLYVGNENLHSKPKVSYVEVEKSTYPLIIHDENL